MEAKPGRSKKLRKKRELAKGDPFLHVSLDKEKEGRSEKERDFLLLSVSGARTAHKANPQRFRTEEKR